VKFRRTMLFAAASSLAFAASAHAQQAAPTTADRPDAQQAEDEAVTGGDVVVTADRREQSLQDYAGTAAAFSGDELQKRGIQDLTDMNAVLPGLTVANNGGNIEVWIRGVGSSNNTELGDPAAATHFDGVYLPRPAGIGSGFFDIQRVEVNVGPQGTLRGRNATAGSVNIISWKPGLNIWDAELEGEYGAYNQTVLRGMVNVPIGTNAAFRLSGMALKHDAYYENVGPVSTVGGAEAEDNVAVRAQFLYEPTERLSFLIAGDYMHETGSGYTGTNYANPLGEGIDPNDIRDPRKVVARAFTPDLDIKHWGVRLEASYKADAFTIDYTGSYRDVVSDYVAATPIGPFYPGILEGLAELPGTLEEELDNFSRFQSITDSKSHYHELRIHRDEGPLIWSLGGLYFREDQYSFLGSTGDRGLFFQGVEFNMPDVDAESWAVYGDATWEVTDRLRLTGGLRYTNDMKSREGVAARYGFALGDGNFNCCGGVRVGTEGFQFAGRDRTIFNPDINGDGTISDAEVIDFYFNGIAQFGVRDNVDEIFANGPFDYVPGQNPTCTDTITGDFFTCDGFEGSGQFTYGVPFQGQIFRQTGKINADFVDWRLRGELDLTDDNLLYALVATGNKSGGFNDNLGDVGVAPTYRPEKVTLYELGSKNQFYLGAVRTRLNGTLFYNDYKDQVLTSLLSVAQAVEFLGGPQNVPLPDNTSLALVVSYSYNAADSAIYGANIEGGFDFPNNMGVKFNALWLEAEVKDAAPIQDFRFQADVAPDEAVFRSIEGKRLPRTPRFQLNGSFSHAIELPSGTFDYVVSAGYRSSQFMTIFNGEDFLQPDNPRLRLNDKVDGYWTFDLGLGYSHGTDGKLRVEGYVNNLTDVQTEAAIIITQFDNTRFFTRPRTYGGRVRLKF
jgi:iron complex outermembrane recepter protein